jgi:hypothetical protein
MFGTYGSFYWTCELSFILTPVPFIFCNFVQWTNKCTINWQIYYTAPYYILLLHVSTLLHHPQGVRSQYIAKLHKYVSAAVGNIIYNFTYVFCCCISVFKIIKNIQIFLFIIKRLKLFCQFFVITKTILIYFNDFKHWDSTAENMWNFKMCHQDWHWHNYVT